jgi:hypothetical protein
VAQADVACGTEGNTGGWCSIIDEITGSTAVFIPPDQPAFRGGLIDKGGVMIEPAPAFPGNPGIVVDDVVAGDVLTIQRDRYWPRSALTLMLLAVGFTAAAVQLVTPTRRWRPRLPAFLRRSRPRGSAE